MWPIALLGFLLHAYLLITGVHDSKQGFFAAAVVIWSAVWVTSWAREERLFSLEYGTDVETEQELVRDEFDDPRKALGDYDLFHAKFDYPLTMEVSHGGHLARRVDSPMMRRLKRMFVTYCFAHRAC